MTPTPRSKTRSKTSGRTIGGRVPADVVLTGYFGLMLLLSIVEARHLPHPARAIGIHAGGLLVGLVLPLAASRLRASVADVLRGAVCMALVPVAFEELGRMVPYIAPDARESWLLYADRILFGSDPTRWTGSTERFPWLTEILQCIYMSFFLLPLALAIVLVAKRDFRALEHSTLVVLLGFFLSYLGYLLVPARSPYHLYAYPFEFEGLGTTPWLRDLLEFLENNKYDCFPSGHSEVAILIAALARRYSRRSFWLFFGPIGVLLPISTVYLRYHYAVDVVAAVLLAVGTWKLAALLERLHPAPSSLPEVARPASVEHAPAGRR
jgi:membrane-associated phospholipid phosphatase